MHLTYGEFTHVERAIETLHGILSGIASDYKLSDMELVRLHQWLNLHESLQWCDVFKEARELIAAMLEDDVIDLDERNEFIEWCQKWIDHESPYEITLTQAVRRLHGFIHAIACDGEITDTEIVDLNDWIQDFNHVRTYWPFSETFSLLEKILADGTIEDSERVEFSRFCEGFIERPVKDISITDTFSESWMQSTSPILQTIAHICEPDVRINIRDHTFCFTGIARSGKRKVLHKMISDRGGIPIKSVTVKLDYLVIGAQSQPCWTFATYGRKIESAMNNKYKRGNPNIVHEDILISQLT